MKLNVWRKHADSSRGVTHMGSLEWLSKHKKENAASKRKEVEMRERRTIKKNRNGGRQEDWAGLKERGRRCPKFPPQSQSSTRHAHDAAGAS
jgi:hypothetical protein